MWPPRLLRSHAVGLKAFQQDGSLQGTRVKTPYPMGTHSSTAMRASFFLRMMESTAGAGILGGRQTHTLLTAPGAIEDSDSAEVSGLGV